jgi:hypothetical protein
MVWAGVTIIVEKVFLEILGVAPDGVVEYLSNHKGKLDGLPSKL